MTLQNLRTKTATVLGSGERNTGGMRHTWDRTLELESFLNRMKRQMIFFEKVLKMKDLNFEIAHK